MSIEERIAIALHERKIRLSREEVRRIASTPQKECWLCAYFTELIDEDEGGYFIYESDLKDEGMWEHLRQLINREP